MVTYDKVEDTFFESFDGMYIKALITAEDELTVKEAAYDATATPSAVIGRVEAGVESFVDGDKTPDGRPGAIVQFWLTDDLKKFEKELSYRIRQDILVKPFTRVFSITEDPVGTIRMIDSVGHCGDSYEWEIEEYGRKLINVPITVPDFQIESELGYAKGIMGGNFWYMCSTKEAVLRAGRIIINTIMEIEDVCTPFGICSAASKPETLFPEIGPSTNHFYCPSLREKLGEESKVPKGINYIPEIVINATNHKTMNLAIKKAIDAIIDIDGVERISAGNFKGKLGKYKTNLLDILK